MKQRILKLSMAITFFAFTLSLDSNAQTRVWSIGPEIGANFSKFGRDASDNDLKAGLIGGLFVTYSTENILAFTGKALFSQKGARIKGNPDDTKRTLNYIEVPLMVRFFLNKEGMFRPNLFVGPSFGFLTGVSNKVGDGKAVKLPNYENYYNPVDVGVTVGLGFNFLVANETRFLIDARYTHGLSDITANDNDFINNQAIAVTAGFSFGF